MICSHCGKSSDTEANYCEGCGKPFQPRAADRMSATMTGILSSAPRVQKLLADKRTYFAVFGAIGGVISAVLYTALYGVLTVNTDSEGGALSTWVVAGGFNG